MKYLGWFSCGVTSAVAIKMAIEEYGKENVELHYFVIDSAHDNNERFIRDCEKWYDLKINRVQGKYTDQFDVIEKTRYVNGPAGARCTLELKKNLRFKLEDNKQDWLGQIFGFEFDKKEINRAIRFSQQYPKAKPVYPLIDSKLNKSQCAELLLLNGIRLPKMYELGFHNNNCIACVKGGRAYFSHVKKHFSDYYERMALLEREIGRSCIKDCFLDELDTTKYKQGEPIVPNCGAVCQTEFEYIIDPEAEKVYAGYKTMKQLKLF